MITLLATSETATAAIGAVIAAHLNTGDVVTLDGDLGAGKTALARAIIRARLAQPDLEVPSPSFAIVQPYPGIIHADLYRLADDSELDELGLFEDEAAIVLVEWPERAPDVSRHAGLGITLTLVPGGEARRIAIEGRGRPTADLEAALADWREDGP